MTRLARSRGIGFGIALLLICVTGLLAQKAANPKNAKSAKSPQSETLAIPPQGEELTIATPKAHIVLAENQAQGYRVTAYIRLADSARAEASLRWAPEKVEDSASPAALRVAINRDADGNVLRVTTQTYDEQAPKKWADKGTENYTFWPAPRAAPKGKAAPKLPAALNGIEPRTWQNQWLKLRAEVSGKTVRVWFEGLLAADVTLDQPAASPLVLTLSKDDQVRDITVEPWSDSSLLPVDLEPLANDHFAKPIGKKTIESGGIQFDLAAGKLDQLSLAQAGWPDAKEDPSAYTAAYDAGPYFLNDPRMPVLRLPVADYIAAHVLAVADTDPQTFPGFTLRAGSFGAGSAPDPRSGVIRHDFPASVPRTGEQAGAVATVVETPAGNLYHVRVAMDDLFAQDLGKPMDVELTKEIRLARRQPDPARFHYRPLGLPSGVRIAAITFEKSPLQMRVTGAEAGNAFVEPQKAQFKIRLENITANEQPYRLAMTATYLDGTETKAEQTGSVPASQTAEITVAAPVVKRGYHDLEIALIDGKGQAILKRHTAFAMLPPDTRKHRDESRLGVWDFTGTHYTSKDSSQVGPLYVKAGLRYGMFGYTIEERQKYGIIKGNEWKVSAEKIGDFAANLEKDPTMMPVGLIFHEDSISGPHITRVPDLFTDRPPYKLDEKEQIRFKEMWEIATTGAKAVREKLPNVHLRFGNGAMPTKEEFYRNKFPANLFDSAGNETGAFERIPETQPPDCVSPNAALWMDRQLLDAYGYKDKPITACYEICVPNTNPGNLDPRTQADYYVRHAMHYWAWDIPQMRVGIIGDVGNSYRFSNWGASGICRMMPEMAVKPSFVSLATLTRVLDGAKLVRVVPLGSDSLYGVEFDRPDGQKAFVLWTLRGQRPVEMQFDAGDWRLTDSQGNESVLRQSAEGRVTVQLASSPIYLVGKGNFLSAAPSQPVYTDKPQGKSTVVASLANLDGWKIVKERDAMLEFYNPMNPRRPGDFSFEPASSVEGKDKPLKVTPKSISTGKDTMPMYAVLENANGIELPGKPTDIGLWINGNSSWGRVIFELTDASGQHWTNIGAPQRGEPPAWLRDGMPQELVDQMKGWKTDIADWNTDDVFGLSRINFDGWRYVSFPLPGNYPGEGYHWPSVSQWRYDKDMTVHYPLKLTKLIVELPEKVLHVKDFAPVKRPEIYLKDVTVSDTGETYIKTFPGEWPNTLTKSAPGWN